MVSACRFDPKILALPFDSNLVTIHGLSDTG